MSQDKKDYYLLAELEDGNKGRVIGWNIKKDLVMIEFTNQNGIRKKVKRNSIIKLQRVKITEEKVKVNAV